MVPEIYFIALSSCNINSCQAVGPQSTEAQIHFHILKMSQRISTKISTFIYLPSFMQSFLQSQLRAKQHKIYNLNNSIYLDHHFITHDNITRV